MIKTRNVKFRDAKSREMFNERKVICFDKDGVLVDISELTYFNRRNAFEHIGREFPYDSETIYKLGGISARYNSGMQQILAIMAFERWHEGHSYTNAKVKDTLRKLILSPDASSTLDMIVSKYQTNEDTEKAKVAYAWHGKKMLTIEEASMYIKPIKGSRDAIFNIKELMKGNVAIITNTPSIEIVTRDLLLAGFSRNDINSLRIITNAKKPSPEHVKETLENFKTNPTEAAYVGDSVIDSRTARNSGVLSVLVLSGMGTKEALSRSNPDVIAKNIKDLSEALRR